VNGKCHFLEGCDFLESDFNDGFSFQSGSVRRVRVISVAVEQVLDDVCYEALFERGWTAITERCGRSKTST
jgi:hypothetical protein